MSCVYNRMEIYLTLIGLSLVLGNLCEAKRQMTLTTAEDTKWVTETNTTMHMANVWGNPKKGPSCGLAKFAKGTDIPMHTGGPCGGNHQWYIDYW